MRNGTIKHSSKIDFTSDLFKRSHKTDPGFYIMLNVWNGPYDTAEDAREFYAEWRAEARCS